MLEVYTLPESGIVKYLVKLSVEVEGVVETADLIGAIFGQTEGLFGPEMNLNELQKTSKVGRIEINLGSREGRSRGEVHVPMSTDISTAALIAAAIESVDKVGPCSARFRLSAIEDVRAVRRKSIAERAKEILRDWSSKTASEGEELLKDVSESTRRAKVISYGREELPAGPAIYTSDTIYLVEGRADVINLIRAGIENAVAIGGTKVPDSVVRLAREKKAIAFLDGDRAGDLILKELNQLARLEGVLRAPSGKEVEDLTPAEILEIVRPEVRPPALPKPAKVPLQPGLTEKAQGVYAEINGSLEALILDQHLNEIVRIPVSELHTKLETVQGAKSLVFDGIVTQRLVDTCSKVGVTSIVGHRVAELGKKLDDIINIATFKDLGLE